MKVKRMLSVLLSALLLCPAAACSEKTGEEPDNAQPAQSVSGEAVPTAAETEAPPEETEPTPDLPAYDCKGENFNVLTKMEGSETGRWTTRDIWVAELTGEPVNDAVFERNLLIQDKYNCVIAQERMNMDQMVAGINRLMKAGDTQFDIVMPNCTSASQLSLDAMLQDLNTLDHVDLSKPWWNAQFTSDTNINGRNYYGNGDISETFMRATYAVFFNKQTIKDYSLENPYELVNDGTWTLEKIQQMGAAFAGDLNGDGQINDADNVGLIVLNNQIECMYTASGEKLIHVTDDGFVFAADGERSLEVLEKIYQLYENKSVVLCPSDANRRSPEVASMGHVEIGEKTFSEGRCLFLMGTMNNVASMRDMETDFGILPIPKADEAQDNYYSYANTWAASCAAVPILVGDIEKSTILMEELAYQSRRYYTPAYYEISLKTKISRDEESAAMLDLIYERRTVDMGNLFSVGGVMSGLSNLIFPTGQNTFASFLKTREKMVRKDMEKLQGLYN